MSDQKTGPREVTIKIPRLPRDKGLAIAGGIGFLIAFIFASTVLGELNQLKQQQKTAEERIKNEVLMPGGTNEYKTEFKPDQSTDTAKDSNTKSTPSPVVTQAPVTPEPAQPPAPAPAPPAPAPAGPGNFDGGYAPSYGGGPTGPGNM